MKGFLKKLEGADAGLFQLAETVDRLRRKIHVDAANFAGPDAREGPRAFVEKRRPVWSDDTGL